MYKRIVKNNQVTYGRPYQIRIPVNLLDYDDPDSDEDDAVNSESDSPVGDEEIPAGIRSKCEMLVREAELEAERLLEHARADAEKQAESITEEAWQRGYAEGMEAAAEQNRTILEEAEKIRREAAVEYDSIMAGMEADMVELVLEAARKAVAAELVTNRKVIIQLVRDALLNCSNKSGAVLKVSAPDYDYIAENADEFQAAADGADELEIRKDSAMKPGDCIIETSLGSVDAGAGTRLDKVEKAFREELEGR